MNAPALRSTALPALVTRLAAHFDMVDVDPAELIDTLKQTAFRTQTGGPVTDAQMTALLIVANQYRLNPWTKEIYAYPAKGGGIVPIVGLDGWANIINSHPQFDGMEFEYDHGESVAKGKPVSVTCVIYRKDRSRPTKITEFYDECYRSTDPWNTMGRRMLRHKAMSQCGRLAFGYGGIYDPEEGATVAGEKFMGMAEEVVPVATAPETYPQDQFDKNLPAWRDVIAKGRKTADQIIGMAETKHPLTDAQKAAVREKAPVDDARIVVTYAQVADKLNAATNMDQLADAGTLIGEVSDPQQRIELTAIYDRRGAELNP